MQLEQLASLLVVGALLAALGRGVTSWVFPDGMSKPIIRALPRKGWAAWRRVFFLTMWLHPIVAGALLGVPDWLPAPAFMGTEDKLLVGRVVWYAVSGVFSSAAFYRVEGTIRGSLASAAAKDADEAGEA